jgi:hypothetical protein
VKKKKGNPKITKTEIHGKGRPVLVPKKRGNRLHAFQKPCSLQFSFRLLSLRGIEFPPGKCMPTPKNAYHERMLIVQKPLLTCVRSIFPRPSYRAPYDSIEYSPRIQCPSFSSVVVLLLSYFLVPLGIRISMCVCSSQVMSLRLSILRVENECPVYNPSMVDVCKNAEKSRIVCCPTPDGLLGI